MTLILCFLTCFSLLTACGGETMLDLTPAYDVLEATGTPTLTLTPTIVKTTVVANTATMLPSPTPTPRTHEVKTGETLSVIAWNYGVSLDALKEMNPDVNVYAMSVGTKLLIPVETLPPGDQTPVPTPVQLPLSELNCQSVADGGIWCFVAVENSSDLVYESVSVNVNIADLDAREVIARTGYAPLNLLFQGEAVPIALYFPAPMPNPFQASVQFAGAIPLDDPGSRYMEISTEGIKIVKSDDLMSADVRGTYTLEENASHVRIVAAAYDNEGNIVGLRRWQLNEGEISGGEFALAVYSVSNPIDELIVYAEAQR